MYDNGNPQTMQQLLQCLIEAAAGIKYETAHVY